MAEPNTVLLVHNFYRVPGGEDTVFAQERRLLEEAGYRVLCYTRHNDEIAAAPWWRKLLLPAVSVFNPRTYGELRRLILREGVQLVHVHNTLALISPAVYAAAASCGVPVVQTVHNYRLLCPQGTCYRAGSVCEDCLQRGLRAALGRRCYRESRAQTALCVLNLWMQRCCGVYKRLFFICLTEFNRSKLLQLPGVRPERVFVRPNTASRLGEPLPPEQRAGFLFAGRLCVLKGLRVLLRAWHLLEQEGDAPLLTICGGGELEEECRRYAREHRLQRVVFRGAMPGNELQQLLRQSRALILPTQWYEGFPMVIAEAFAAETPVLCSALGNAGSLVREGETGMRFRHDSPEDLADTVRRFCRIPAAHWEQPVRACYEAHYTPQRSAEQLRAIYRQAAEAPDE
ncbi:MAG: glycosyltransferase family 4 protein [Akkermansia sp.]